MITGSPLFELRGVEFAYDDGSVALRGVGLEIYAAEKIAVIGANGSGKSSLLKILDGLLWPQRGSVRFRGEALTEASLRNPKTNAAFRSAVGFVFQNPDAQLFCPTVWDEIAFGPAQAGWAVAATDTRVREMLSLFRLESLKDRAPYHLSGGEKKRVALAAAWALEPDVLLLDEPTAALDPRSKSELLDLMLELHRRGKTLVTATHDLDIVEAIGDRLIVLGEDRRVLDSGPAETLLQNSVLLESANLIHVHTHGHAGHEHRHAHIHKPKSHDHH